MRRKFNCGPQVGMNAKLGDQGELRKEREEFNRSPLGGFETDQAD